MSESGVLWTNEQAINLYYKGSLFIAVGHCANPNRRAFKPWIAKNYPPLRIQRNSFHISKCGIAPKRVCEGLKT